MGLENVEGKTHHPLRALRKAERWSQALLGKELGVSAQQVWLWENRLSKIPKRHAETLSEILKCPLSALEPYTGMPR